MIITVVASRTGRSVAKAFKNTVQFRVQRHGTVRFFRNARRSSYDSVRGVSTAQKKLQALGKTKFAMFSRSNGRIRTHVVRDFTEREHRLVRSEDLQQY